MDGTKAFTGYSGPGCRSDRWQAELRGGRGPFRRQRVDRDPLAAKYAGTWSGYGQALRHQ